MPTAGPMAIRVLSMADTSDCDDVLDPLRRVAEVLVRPADAATLAQLIAAADVYLASLHVRLDAAAINSATRLKAIATPSTGLDHIDPAAAQQRGVTVLSLKDDKAFLNSLTATAELAWALLLSVVRRLPWAVQAAHRGDWARDRFRGHQLSGKTLGIVGYGRLGRMVGEFGKAFRMRVIATDVTSMQPEADVELMPLAQLLPQADVVSIHVHLTDATRGLFGREQIATMKRGAVLINTSRGAIVDEAALLDALESGALLGAGLDVIDGEWRPDLASHPLIRYAGAHENLVISPHIGGVTYESQRMAYARTVEMILKFLRERQLV
jgi:D-3-phosphoglycerate dehydrogenase / 2-oxoglutarate reductase